jgi:hypothetical protein
VAFDNRRLRASEKRAARLKVPRRVRDSFGRYRDDPVAFARDCLGVESATRRSDGSAYQFEILDALRDEPRLAVRSGHGTGKTAALAWAVLWWTICRQGLALILAPEFERQIRSILFAELRKWARRATVPLPVEVLSNRLLLAGHEVAIGMSAAGLPERLEGFHSEAGVLLVGDEVKAIPQDALDAMMGTLSGLEANRLVLASTPGAQVGPFYRACSSPAWRVLHLSSEDSSLVSPAWVEDRAAEWGRGSALFETRVLGLFASEGEGQLCPLGLLEAAVERGRSGVAEGETVMGVDVARSVSGDASCLAVVQGSTLRRLVVFRLADTMAVVQRVMAEVALAHPARIRVDESGPGGGVVDRLRQLSYRVEGVPFGGRASDPTRFLNARAEMFWHVRAALDAGTLALPDDPDLLADLTSLRFELLPRGTLKIESKEEIRRRLGRSPDRADALALALGTGRRMGQPWRYVRFYQGSPCMVVPLNESRMGHPQTWPSPYAVKF